MILYISINYLYVSLFIYLYIEYICDVILDNLRCSKISFLEYIVNSDEGILKCFKVLFQNMP